MPIYVVQCVLYKLPGGHALLWVVYIKNKKCLEAHIHSLQQRGCFNGMPGDDDECLVRDKFISEAENMRTLLVYLRCINIFHHVGPDLLITHQSVSVVCIAGTQIMELNL